MFDVFCSLKISGGEGVTCICRNTGMCHYFGYFFGGCSRIIGYHFLAIPGFLGIIFLVNFDFFKNNPELFKNNPGVLILIFPSMTLWNVARSALVSYFFAEMSNDSAVLVSVLLCLCKEFHIVYNCYQFEFVYL